MSITIGGLACPFNVWSDSESYKRDNLPDDPFSTLYLPGCFKSTIAARNGRLLVEHWKHLELANVTAGTLDLWEESAGLMFSARLPDSDFGNYVAVGVRLGIVKHVCCHTYMNRPIGPDETRVVIDVVKKVEPALLFFMAPHHYSTSVAIGDPRVTVEPSMRASI